MDELTVTIPLDDYRYLVQKDNEFDILISCLLYHATLNYSKDGLSIDSSTASAVVQAICPNDFNTIIKKLKKEEEEKHNERID